ncbi:MAG: hypothetical protein LBT64_01405 [Puniceicoccales bacterium]|jgi:hypothetical protein|nr:hypothetical protein [Puniceicoccales bacterium]
MSNDNKEIASTLQNISGQRTAGDSQQFNASDVTVGTNTVFDTENRIDTEKLQELKERSAIVIVMDSVKNFIKIFMQLLGFGRSPSKKDTASTDIKSGSTEGTEKSLADNTALKTAESAAGINSSDKSKILNSIEIANDKVSAAEEKVKELRTDLLFIELSTSPMSFDDKNKRLSEVGKKLCDAYTTLIAAHKIAGQTYDAMAKDAVNFTNEECIEAKTNSKTAHLNDNACATERMQALNKYVLGKYENQYPSYY